MPLFLVVGYFQSMQSVTLYRTNLVDTFSHEDLSLEKNIDSAAAAASEELE